MLEILGSFPSAATKAKQTPPPNLAEGQWSGDNNEIYWDISCLHKIFLIGIKKPCLVPSVIFGVENIVAFWLTVSFCREGACFLVADTQVLLSGRISGV